MDLQPKTTTYSPVDDRAWLVGQHGIDLNKTITLDASKFSVGAQEQSIQTLAGTTRNYVKSGVALGFITATKLYGPYDPAATDGRQTCVGLLYTAVELTGSAKVAGALFRHGVVKASALPVASGAVGGVDNAAKGSLGHRILFD